MFRCKITSLVLFVPARAQGRIRCKMFASNLLTQKLLQLKCGEINFRKQDTAEVLSEALFTDASA